MLARDQPARIVGIVANTKHRSLQETEAASILYKPILDTGPIEASFGGVTLLARSQRDPASLGAELRRRLLARDPDLAVNLAGTLAAHVEGSLVVPRLAAMLFGLCGGGGLLIAAIGVYGVISFSVARRTREIGIRLALGAQRAQVIRMVLWHGAALALVGVALGLGGGAALAFGARGLLVGVRPSDPATFLVVPLVLLAVALAATAIPARRAAWIDPHRTLRSE